MKKLIVALIIALSVLGLYSCQSSCNCGYAQSAPSDVQVETNL